MIIKKIKHPYRDEKEARQQIIGETINAPEWAGTRPDGQPRGGATSLQVDGDGSIIGGDLLFRGGSDIIGVPGNSTQITVPAGNRLRLYSGTVSYRPGSSKNSGRSEKTFKGISRVNAKDFVEIANRNKRNHKFGSSVVPAQATTPYSLPSPTTSHLAVFSGA